MLTGISDWQVQNNPWSSFPVIPPLAFFFSNLYFYWRIIALQNFVVFCQTSTWISHRYTYIPSLLNLPPTSLPIPLLCVDTEPLFEFPKPYRKFPLPIYFTYGNLSFQITLSIYLTLSSPLPMSISLFSMFLHCCPVNKFFSTIFLDSIYMC